MNANELRRAFQSYFERNGHTVVPSASLIPHDATLLFTNSGMVPFKPFFQGVQTPPYRRAVSVQKCVRAGGKHNDLDEVGRTSRHLTFFEMLGNFSFGDYFKDRAIPMAWEFCTTVLGLPPERLWITVHHTDDEAADIWADTVGVPRDRIQRLGDADNWWRMADTGPNGPCSEIFFDKGPQFGPDGGPLNPEADERFVEIWNLVFMQFDQQPDGTQVPLPAPSIDTGAGLERVLSVLAGVESVWETDEFQRLLAVAGAAAHIVPGADPRADVSLRILADHARSTTFLVSDGVFPSNEERGYVLRRIIRRAVRHAYLLGVTTPIMGIMVDAVVEIMGSDYPDLVANHQFVREVLLREETRFRETLASGLTLLEAELELLGEGQPVPGDIVFLLHDTYGFPRELTEEITAERGIRIDHAGFDAAMDEQRRRAKEAQRRVAEVADQAAFHALVDEHGPTEFVRDTGEAVGTVLYADADTIVLDRTPFYAESGGQVGDTGTITTATGTATIADTTAAVPGLTRHHVIAVDGAVVAGQEARARIDTARRAAIRRHHTATHLLHWALRAVLGEHVKQQGSYVGPDRLRFDFSHYEGLTPEQTAAIEDLVNSEILGNAAVRHFETTMDDARRRGAIAFFGDKYGDIVRVLEAGAHSLELCGGTHVGALGDIGPVKVVSEGSIGSNIRRVEAVAGTRTIELLRQEAATLRQAADLVGVPVDTLLDGLAKRLGEIKVLRDEVRSLRQQAAARRSGELAAAAQDGVVVARVDVADRDALKELVLAVRAEGGVRAVVLGAALDGGGVALAAATDPTGGLHAGELIGDAAKLIKGGGGKGADFAMAGGKDAAGLEEALAAAAFAAGLV
jgi:alanyl-tRNA synthetase